MLTRCSLGLFSLGIGTVSLACTLEDAAVSQTSLDVCGLESLPAQHKLKGGVGTSPGNPYWFSHVSAVVSHDDKPTNRYVFEISNHHPNSYLPVKWVGSDGKEWVHFEEVPPYGCAVSNREESRTFLEVSQARVEYDPLLRRRNDAPLYRPSGDVPLSVPEDQAELRSFIVADIAVQREERLIHLDVTTEFRGGMVVNTIWNVGSQDEIFRVPESVSAWDQMQAVAQVTVEQDWPRRDELFIALATDEPDQQIFMVPENVVLRAIPVPLEILSEDGRVAVRAHVTLHVPLVPGEV